MEIQRPPTSPNTLSPKTIEWLQLCKELHDRITDPELQALLHRFISVDLEICQEEIKAAYEAGIAARMDT